MLMNHDESLLVLVDVQEKLTPHVQNAPQLIENCEWMLKLATALSVPVLITEQYPEGLGQTLEPLEKAAPEAVKASKVHFSCAADETCFNEIEESGCSQIILMGIEAHVCVLQTALELVADDEFQVFVVTDAISSRQEYDKKIALKRLFGEGVSLVTKEMVLFEWLKQAKTPLFKTISQQFLK